MTAEFAPGGTLRTIILLAGEAEADALGQLLESYNADLTVIPAVDRAALDQACAHAGDGVRLLSFCSSVIVPKAHLASMNCGAYNFHPGPPSYPGRYPSVFALYDGVKTFGVTFHSMAERVDEGPIITAEWFTVPDGCDLEALDTLAFKALVSLFQRLAKRLATDRALLKPKPIGWSGKKWSKADCEALCVIDDTQSPEEQARRTRACGIHLIRKT